MESNKCVNCQQELKGKFCHHCGEKVITTSDFTIWSLFKQATSFFTNFDSRLFRTLIPLVAKPGFLTNEFIRGKRKPYMPPFQIFIICNILFFIFLSDADILRAPAKWFIVEDFQIEKVNAIAERKQISSEEVKVLFDAKTNNYAKGLIFLLLPVLGSIFHFLNYKKNFQFSKSVILATHHLSFFLVSVIVLENVLDLMRLLGVLSGNLSNYFRIAIISFIIYFTFFSLRRVSGRRVISALLRTLVISILYLAAILTYRSGISYLTLYTM